MTAPLPGDRLGNYTLVRCLGAGGMAVVWEARLTGPGGFVKPVALKLLHTGPADDRNRQALLEEAKLGALLHHPNIVSVMALEEHDGRWVLAMELIQGGNLSQLLRVGPLSGKALQTVGVQTCAGLQHIHDFRVGEHPLGLVHRDIKPMNLLVDVTGMLKVADLGIAAAVGAGTVAGTPGYAAPEQVKGHGEPRSDLFALGITLYVCATGRRPLGRGAQALEQLEHLDELTEDPAFFTPADEVLPGLGAVLRRCLRVDPSQRFSSASELQEALSHLDPPDGPTLLDQLAMACPYLSIEPSSLPPSPSSPTLLKGGNLQPARDAFFGRAEQVEALLDMLMGGARAVTVLGPGGMGKTRLSLEAARRLQVELPGGAWFVDLSEVRSLDDLCVAVGRALDLPLDRTDPVAQLGWALKARRKALFVLDNVEQCVEHLPATLGRWLQVADQGQFVCTSRILPDLRGMQVHTLEPLRPDEAVELFLDRAPATIPAAHQGDVRSVVEALECMPLAIELAAARTRLLTAPLLRERLALRLLSGGSRELPARHRSIEASLEWSWELLHAHGRSAMAQLSVFEGGFDLDAAEALLELPVDAGWALDVLQELVDASLVKVDPTTGRFTMLVVVQQFAAARLEDTSAAEGRHGDWFAQARDLARPRDLANLSAACERAIARGDRRVAAGCALGAWHLLQEQGPIPVALGLFEAVRSCPGHDLEVELSLGWAEALLAAGRALEAREVLELLEPTLQATGAPSSEAERLGLLGSAEHVLGHLGDARVHLEAAAALHARAHRLSRRGIVLGTLGVVRRALGQPDAALHDLETALAIHRAEHAPRHEAAVRGYLANLHLQQGRPTEALEEYELALALYRSLGNRSGEARVRGNLASLYRHQGRLPEAIVHCETALAGHRRVGDRRSEAIELGKLGGLSYVSGHIEQARQHYEQAIAMHQEVGNRRFEGVVLSNLANLHFVRGEIERGIELCGAAMVIHREIGNRTSAATLQGNLGILMLALGRLEEAHSALESALLESREVKDRRIEGFVLDALAQLQARRDRPDAARDLVEQALTIARDIDMPVLIGTALTTKGDLQRQAGELDAATTSLIEAEKVLEEADAKDALAHMQCARALLARDSGESEAAARCLKAAETLRRELGALDASPLGRRVSQVRELLDRARRP